MKSDKQVMVEMRQKGRAGRKPVVSQEIMPVIRQLRRYGYGYRKIARILRDEFDISIHWSSVRNFIRNWSCYRDCYE